MSHLGNVQCEKLLPEPALVQHWWAKPDIEEIDEELRFTADTADRGMNSHEADNLPWLRVFQSHGDCVVRLPPEAQRLARSETTVNEMFSYKDFVVGLQGHPEFTSAVMTDIILPAVEKKLSLAQRQGFLESLEQPRHSAIMIRVRFVCISR